MTYNLKFILDFCCAKPLLCLFVSNLSLNSKASLLLNFNRKMLFVQFLFTFVCIPGAVYSQQFAFQARTVCGDTGFSVDCTLYANGNQIDYSPNMDACTNQRQAHFIPQGSINVIFHCWIAGGITPLVFFFASKNGRILWRHKP